MTQLSFFPPTKGDPWPAMSPADQAIIDAGAYWVRLSIARRNKVARYVTPDQMEALEADMRKHARFVSKHGWLQPCEECGYWAYVLDELGLPPEN